MYFKFKILTRVEKILVHILTDYQNRPNQEQHKQSIIKQINLNWTNKKIELGLG